MKRKRVIACAAAMTLAIQEVPCAAEAIENEANQEKEASENGSEYGQAVIQVVDGKLCWFSGDGVLEEDKTEELQNAAREETDITALLELLGEPESEEYFGQGCWYGESGEETGEDGAWYYEDFTVYVYKTDSITYYMGIGDAVGQGTSLESQVEELVREQTGDLSGTNEKLKKLFEYVEENYEYVRKTGFESYSSWHEDYAQEMIGEGGGSCYHFAALYAYLVKAATGLRVRICLGKTDGFEEDSWQQHAWTEVKIDGAWYVFDTNMDKYAADSSMKYYMLAVDSQLYAEVYQPEKICALLSDENSSPETTGIEETSEETTETEETPEETSKEATETEETAGKTTETEETSEETSQKTTETEETAGETTEAEETSEETTEEEEIAEETEETEETEEAEETEETEADAAVMMTDTVSVTENGQIVLELKNRSGLDYSGAVLTDGRLLLTDESGAEHEFLEVDAADMSDPILVMYGSFLAIKYTSAGSGKAARLTEEGEEIVFSEPQTMSVTGNVNVRAQGDLSARVLTVLAKGKSITVIGETGKWYKITLDNGQEGYVSKVCVIVEDAETSPAAVSVSAATPTPSPTPTPELVIVEDDGKYYQYERFTPTEDTIVKIGKKRYYYVEAGGTFSEGWKVLDGKLYYSEADGRLKCSCTWEGISLGKKGAAEESTDTSLKIVTVQILDSIITDGMTDSEKLSACWNYVTGGHLSYSGKYPNLSTSGWQRTLALDALTSGSGNCYGFACAFAALAKEVGYEPVVVCGRVSGSRDQAADGMTRHSWVMINGLHYDPEAQWAGWHRGIYGYGSYPVYHTVQTTVVF